MRIIVTEKEFKHILKEYIKQEQENVENINEGWLKNTALAASIAAASSFAPQKANAQTNNAPTPQNMSAAMINHGYNNQQIDSIRQTTLNDVNSALRRGRQDKAMYQYLTTAGKINNNDSNNKQLTVIHDSQGTNYKQAQKILSNKNINFKDYKIFQVKQNDNTYSLYVMPNNMTTDQLKQSTAFNFSDFDI